MFPVWAFAGDVESRLQLELRRRGKSERERENTGVIHPVVITRLYKQWNRRWMN